MTRQPPLYLWCSVVSTKHKVNAKSGRSEVVARLVVLATSAAEARKYAQQIIDDRDMGGVGRYCGVPIKITATQGWSVGRKATKELPR